MPRNISWIDRFAEVDEYPSWDFERFYQLGKTSKRWGLPHALRLRALRTQMAEFESTTGEVTHLWQRRAFAQGFNHETRDSRIPHDYEWPSPPSGWQLVICAYPQGVCELDFVHPVSRRFWSEGNPFLKLPFECASFFRRSVFLDLGFDIIDFGMPTAKVVPSQHQSHLVLARRN